MSLDGSVAEEDNPSGSKFTTVDYTVFSLMLAASVGIGVYSALRGRGNTSTVEYLLGGRKMSPVPVAFSLLGAVISAISILASAMTLVPFNDDTAARATWVVLFLVTFCLSSTGNAAEIYLFGTQLATCLLGIIIACVFVHQVTIPVLFNLKLVSINEYLELRFKSRLLRQIVTAGSIIYGIFLMGILLYTPSLALTTVTNLSTTVSVVAMGIICTFYITIGGVKAVVYIDVLQITCMVLGVLVVVIICCVDLGGFGVVWDMALQGSRVEFFNMSLDPFIRHTLWSTMAMGFHVILYTFAFHQSSFQRLSSVGNVQKSKRLCIIYGMGFSIMWLLFFFSGLVAFATYIDCDPLTSGKINKPDQILPFLVVDKLAHLPGVPGIFVAATYAAVLSSIAGSGNSLACLLWQDFLKDLRCFRDISDEGATQSLKVISLAAGLTGTGVGLLVGQLGGVFKAVLNISGVVYGSISGIFIAGMCTPWVNAKGAVVGSLTAFAFNAWISVGSYVYGGGEANILPLSTAGCLEDLAPPYNTVVVFASNTSDTLLYNTRDNDSLLVNTTLFVAAVPAAVRGSPMNSIYDISYCYTGVMGILITFLASNLVSLCTGPLNPSSLAEGVVNPTCGRLHKWLWKVFRGPETLTSDNHHPQIENKD